MRPSIQAPLSGKNSARLRLFAAVLLSSLLCLTLAADLHAQKVKREPLTEAQQDQIADAGVDPVARVDLYVKFLNEHADTIKRLIPRAHSGARSARLDSELQDFAALLDELGDNLDVYSDRKADIRRSLKGLNEGVQHWQEMLNSLPSEPGFELSREGALESNHDLSALATQVTTDQTAYFKEHKDEKDQDRAEPK
jgi:hypothetical protein